MKIKEKVGEITINPKNKIIINITAFEKKDKIDIRSWFMSDEGEWLPTKRGLTLEAKYRDEIIRLLGLIDTSTMVKNETSTSTP